MYLSIYVVCILLFYLVESTNKELSIAVVLCICIRHNLSNKYVEQTRRNNFQKLQPKDMYNVFFCFM